MPDIKLLDNNLINKIAAGEVIERPANVIKELVENSLDAGATSITVEITDGGASLIRVTDNGSGIPCDQLKTAFMRHATSKIDNLDSLENVLTLGFRGEALACISGVSKLEALTKVNSSETGAKITVHGGEIIEQEEIACANGTVFTIRNLFYNTPARRKFLKSTASEAAFITETIQKLALSRADVAFKYINNSSIVLQTDGSCVENAFFNIYGSEAAQKSLNVSHSGAVTVTGIITKPEFNRSNRQYCNFFINSRYIKSELLQSAVEEAYKTRLPIGRFPVFALYLNISPGEIDINVHPSKLEVKFSDEPMIRSIVSEAVKQSLSAETLITKPLSASSSETKRIFAEESYYADPLPLLYASFSEKFDDEDEIGFGEEDFDDYDKLLYETEPIKEPVSETVIKPAVQHDPFFKNYNIIGRIFANYWIIEQNDSVFLIDQHAAHERVLYEELTKKLKKPPILNQRLAVPCAVRLSPVEAAAISEPETLKALEDIGFELEPFGNDTFALRSVPYIFGSPSNFYYFDEIINALVEQRNDSTCTIHSTIAMAACKAAIKANDRISEHEVKALITKMLKLENPFTCPHGRPSIIELTKHEIEKMFKRI